MIILSSPAGTASGLSGSTFVCAADRQSVSAQPSAVAFRFEDLIAGAKPRHGAKPLLGKLLLPKLHVPVEKNCTIKITTFFSSPAGKETKLNRTIVEV